MKNMISVLLLIYQIFYGFRKQVYPNSLSQEPTQQLQNLNIKFNNPVISLKLIWEFCRFEHMEKFPNTMNSF